MVGEINGGYIPFGPSVSSMMLIGNRIGTPCGTLTVRTGVVPQVVADVVGGMVVQRKMGPGLKVCAQYPVGSLKALQDGACWFGGIIVACLSGSLPIT